MTAEYGFLSPYSMKTIFFSVTGLTPPTHDRPRTGIIIP
ncbi:hypothetical protein GMO_01720 [Gluconobacter morbifer G707]|uniref:Uncharacterized protein n=1 Tax=Gluconobacter morbifer G707 TaxID=1088869 RepID=G6XFA7_9PROT|nr:hypothetical protein GMO_01720 [Gluconobacter morbifer G707]